MNTPTTPAPDAAQQTRAPDLPDQSGLQILINWVVLTLGLGGVAALGAVLPEFL